MTKDLNDIFLLEVNVAHLQNSLCIFCSHFFESTPNYVLLTKEKYLLSHEPDALDSTIFRGIHQSFNILNTMVQCSRLKC